MSHVDPSKSSSTSPPTLSRLGRAALVYAERFGWAVHPLKPGAKTPITAHGFKDASTDPAQITAWWTLQPSIQRVFHPGGRVQANIPDAWAVIIQTTLRF